MTSQGAGASTDPLDLDEADRLAESIRPAWETEEAAAAGAAAAESAARAPAGAEVLTPAKTTEEAPLDVDALDAAAQAYEPPRDTVIDGSPLVKVGNTDPGASSDKSEKAKQAPAKAISPVQPKAAAKTQLGLGTDDEPRVSRSAAKTLMGPASAPPPAPEPAAPAVAPAAKTKSGVGTEEPAPRSSKPRRSRTSTSREKEGPISEARPLAGPAAGSTGPTFSRVDDPVEIPVEKGPKTAFYLGGAVLAVGAIVVGSMLFSGGGDEKAPAPAKTTQGAAPVQPEPPKPEPPKPAVTEKPAAEPAPTAEPTPTTEPTSAPTAEPAKPEPQAEAPKPKPTGDKPPGSKPPAGGQKPPAGGGGKGIMRDAPF